MKKNLNEETKNYIKKTIETFHTTEENINSIKKLIPNLNNKLINTLNYSFTNKLYQNPDEDLPCSIYKDMTSCSNYLNKLQELNSSLKLENERLKKELNEKNKMIYEFEQVSEEAKNKFQKFEEMMKKQYCNLYNQIEQIGKMFNIPIGNDFVYKIQQNLSFSNNENKTFNEKFCYLEEENYNLRKNIDNLNYENNKLEMLCNDFQKQINNLKCNFQMKEDDYNRKDNDNLNKIFELNNYLCKKENDIICLQNEISKLRNQICEFQKNNCNCKNNCSDNPNFQNIIYSQ